MVKTNPVEHISHYNQSMAIYSKNEALMCKLFPSNLGPTTMRRFDGLEKDSIHGYDELIRSFGAQFITCSRTPKAFDSLFTMSINLRAYLDHYWDLYNEIGGDNGGIAASTFKMGLLIDSKLRVLLALKLVTDMHKLMERVEKYKRLEND